MVALSPVPEISISFAPPEEPLAEPFSPFSSCSPSTPDDSDNFRPTLLTPPPALHSRCLRQHSPLRPSDTPLTGKGIERERFEELLRASRERNAAMGCKKSPDLRKEIAIKVHKSKQAERRALFLSKIRAPPSPSATLLPKTPPDSPAIFHYSLPSPGLQSPLAVFEKYASEDPAKPRRTTWVEQVEFRTPGQLCPKRPARSAPVLSKTKLPSLDQITAHLNVYGSATLPRRESSRLPAFLQSGGRRTPPQERGAPIALASAPVVKAKSVLSPDEGRIPFPTRPPSPPSIESAKTGVLSPSPRFPPSPRSPMPKIQVTTMVVPRTSAKSPTAFTESNLRALNLARERKAQDMLKCLRRRTLQPGVLEGLAKAHDFGKDEEDGRKLRRHSAPPELVMRERTGFATAKLDLPGAF